MFWFCRCLVFAGLDCFVLVWCCYLLLIDCLFAVSLWFIAVIFGSCFNSVALYVILDMICLFGCSCGLYLWLTACGLVVVYNYPVWVAACGWLFISDCCWFFVLGVCYASCFLLWFACWLCLLTVRLVACGLFNVDLFVVGVDVFVFIWCCLILC